jgi:hypothetical protein
MLVVLAVDPTLAAWGQLAAIIICLYIVPFVLIALAFNVAMAFGLGWVREKINLIKMLRPTVESVNKTTEAVMEGLPVEMNENKVVRTIAEGPAGVHTIDKQVDKGADKVTNAVIEFRARTVQVQGIVKAFLAPRTPRTKQIPAADVSGTGLEFNSPGYRALMEQKAGKPPAKEPVPGGGYLQTVPSPQPKDVPSH